MKTITMLVILAGLAPAAQAADGAAYAALGAEAGAGRAALPEPGLPAEERGGNPMIDVYTGNHNNQPVIPTELQYAMGAASRLNKDLKARGVKADIRVIAQSHEFAIKAAFRSASDLELAKGLFRQEEDGPSYRGVPVVITVSGEKGVDQQISVWNSHNQLPPAPPELHQAMGVSAGLARELKQRGIAAKVRLIYDDSDYAIRVVFGSAAGFEQAKPMFRQEAGGFSYQGIKIIPLLKN